MLAIRMMITITFSVYSIKTLGELCNQAPSLICLTKHHLMDHEVDALHIKIYNLGAKICRRKLKKNGRVCIYIYIYIL
jgi:hypothetical protein